MRSAFLQRSAANVSVLCNSSQKTPILVRPAFHQRSGIKDDEIADILKNLARNPLGLERDEDFRISIAGAQEKTALLRYKGRWQKPVGTTPTTHILKPQIGELPNGIEELSNSVENEYFCLTFSKALGLPSANVEIATFDDKRVLIVERFDRQFTDDNRLLRVPQEDCCQALSVPWTNKYENEGGPGVQQILRLLEGSDNADADRRRFFKTIIVFWLLGATGGGRKNLGVSCHRAAVTGSRHSMT